MKQVLIKGGKAAVEEVPSPSLAPGMVLVRNAFSLISSGTESGLVSDGGVAGYALKKARDPLNVEKVRRKLAAVGIRGTLDVIRNKLLAYQVPGYSCAGVVVAVASDVPGYAVGDRVACAGVGYACHAEVVAVPHALVTPLPDALPLDAGAFVALGAIALHGVRQGEITLGETVVVSGLGLVGQLAVQLARAAGARVIGCDPVEEKRALAAQLGAEQACAPAELQRVVDDATAGFGADVVLICAASKGSEVTEQALEVCRQRGRVVVVGAVGMQLPREPMYRKEITFRLSCSYGPGRYSPDYEEKGVDYPLAYVRWTEGRNMAAFLRLVANGQVAVKPLISRVAPVDEAASAYDAVLSSDPNLIAALLSYEQAGEDPRPTLLLKASGSASGAIGLGLIGAGAFATGVHLPNLKRIGGCRLEAVCARTGPNAKQAAERFGARLCATDYHEVLADSKVDAVLVATRHSSHAQIVLDALHAGKHVFVEKPLALTVADAERIVAAASDTGKLVAVGFNRRCSALALAARDAVRRAPGPATVLYRCNAGPLPADHWTRDPAEGGRFLGEAVHFLDWVCWLLDSRPVSISAEHAALPGQQAGDENRVASLRMGNGAVATVAYYTNGSPLLPKERIEIFAGGGSCVLDDWKSIAFHGLPGSNTQARAQDKGQDALLANFLAAIRGETTLAATAEDGLWATRIALEAMGAGAEM